MADADRDIVNPDTGDHGTGDHDTRDHDTRDTRDHDTGDHGGDSYRRGADRRAWGKPSPPVVSRAAGTQVISSRVPTALAEELIAEARRRRVRPSELVRDAIEALLHPGYGRAAMTTTGCHIRVVSPANPYRTENPNLVVENVVEPALPRPADHSHRDSTATAIMS